MIADTTEDRARAVHARLAAVFERTERPPFDRVARHLARSGQSARACRYAAKAAEEAELALAFERAAALYRLAASTADAAERAPLLPKLAAALSLAGHTLEAAELHLEIAGAATAGERLEHQRLAADDLLRGGRIDRALELLSDVAGELGIPIAKRNLPALLGFGFRRSQLALRGLEYTARAAEEIPPRTAKRLDTIGTVAASLAVADPLRGAIVHSRYLLDALDVGDERHVCRALTVDACLRAALGDDEAATRLAQKVSRIALRLGDPTDRMWAELALAVTAHCDYRFETASEHFAEAERLQRHGATATHWDRTTTRLYHYFSSQYYLGGYRTAASDLEDAIEDARRRNDLHARSVFGASPLMWLRLADDRPEDALTSLATALDGWPKNSFYMMHYFVDFATAATHSYMGHLDRAADLAATLHRKAAAAGLHRVGQIRHDGDRIVATTSIAARRFDVARAHVRQLARLKYAAMQGAAAMLAASLAAHAGDEDEARERLLDAVALLQRAKTGSWLAAVRYRLGRLLGGSEGAALVEQASAWSDAEGILAPEKIYALHCPWPESARVSG